MTWRLVVALSTTLLLVSPPCGAVGQTVSPSVLVPTRDSGDTSAGESRPPAQETRRARLSASRLSVWAAGSVHPGGVLGTLQDGWFGLVGVRYHRLLLPVRRPNVPPADGPTLTYTADAIPVARVRVPKGTPPNTHASSIRSVTEEGLSTYGFGLYPLGLRVGFRPSSALRPFVAGHTGLFYLFDAMPDERGRHTNFAVGIGGGVEISLGRRATLTLGYRYHHLSNGFRGRINPGLDANLLYVDLGTTL